MVKPNFWPLVLSTCFFLFYFPLAIGHVTANSNLPCHSSQLTSPASTNTQYKINTETISILWSSTTCVLDWRVLFGHQVGQYLVLVSLMCQHLWILAFTSHLLHIFSRLFSSWWVVGLDRFSTFSWWASCLYPGKDFQPLNIEFHGKHGML